MDNYKVDLTGILESETTPLNRVIPDESTRLKIVTALESAQKPSPQDILVLGLVKSIQGVLAESDEMLKSGIEKMKEAASFKETESTALVELAWISCFHPYDGNSEEWVNKALEIVPENNLVKKAKGFLDKRQSGQPVSPYGEHLFPEDHFGNLHHPRKIENDSPLFFLALFKKLLAGSSDSELFFEGAMLAFVLGQYELSKEWLNKILDSHPDQIDAMAFLGWVEEKMGNTQKSLEQYEAVCAMDPNHPLACTNLAAYYQQVGVVFKAEDYLNRALSVAPEYAEALFLSGRNASFKGEGEAAIEYLKRAITLDSEIQDYHLEYCVGLLRTGNVLKLQAEWSFHKKYIPSFTDLGGLRRLFNMVLASAKEPLQNLGVAEMLNKNGFYQAARFFIQRAWKRSYTVDKSKAKQFFYYAGMHGAQCGEFEIALEAYQKLESLETKGGMATTCVALALSDLGRHAEALKCLESCDVTDPNLKQLKADMLWKENQLEPALALYSEISEVVEPQPLAVLSGLACALQIPDEKSVEKIIGIAQEKFPTSTRMMGAVGSAKLQIGKAEKVIQELESQLLKNGQFEIPTSPPNAKSIEENKNAPFLALGCAYLKTRQKDRLNTLLKWLSRHLPQGLSEWEMLQAEGLRLEGEPQQALTKISGSNQHPSALLTKALCFRDLKDEAELQKTLGKIPKEKMSLKFAYHPEGDIGSVIQSLSQHQPAFS